MKWINPMERLPESEDYVLITIKAGTDTTTGECVYDETIPAFFVNDAKCKDGVQLDGLWYPHFYEWQSDHIFENSNVIAWMPFPKPYSEEDTELQQA